MKYIFLLSLLCVGCAASEQKLTPPPAAPTAPIPECRTVPSNCSDQLTLISEEDLKKGFSCPANSRLTFPSGYYSIQQGKVLVMCQCRN